MNENSSEIKASDFQVQVPPKAELASGLRQVGRFL